MLQKTPPSTSLSWFTPSGWTGWIHETVGRASTANDVHAGQIKAKSPIWYCNIRRGQFDCR